jgi:hypothetical protein
MSQNPNLTSFVRSMRKSLKTEHQLDVPYTALRAAYLRACGENPHAFSGKPVRENPVKPASKPPRAEKPQTREPADSNIELDWYVRLYLVEDEIGCLERLALDPEGQYLIPEDWTFSTAELIHQYAKLPSIRRYGLPDYIQNPSEFYARFGLKAQHARADFDDLGDDSGDTCELEIDIANDELAQVLLATLRDAEGLEDLVAEATGLHYGKNFAAESPARQAEYFARYAQLDMCRYPALPEETPVTFEWVWPDESSDSVQMHLNLTTGALRQVSDEDVVPDDVVHPEVRVRVLLPEIEDGDMYDVCFAIDSKGTTYSLETHDLREIRRALRETSLQG